MIAEVAAPCWIRSYSSAASSIALVGMQPQCRHVPPSLGCWSIERDLEAQLAGAESGRIAAGAAAEDDQVEAVGGADCHAQSACIDGGNHVPDGTALRNTGTAA